MLDKVTDFLLFLGKLVVTATVAILSFYYFSGGLTTYTDQVLSQQSGSTSKAGRPGVLLPI